MNSVRADLDHEIPNGSKLYFGKAASIKREIENYAASVFKEYKFEEILTPYFSYHQNLSVSSEQLLKFSDLTNHDISLRADSTVDVVRIVLRRIKNENLKRLFYIQPVFKYPNSENYQIGAELISESNLALSIEMVSKIFDKFGLKPNLQISNIEIPKLVCKILEIPISTFERGDMEVVLNKDIKWLNALARLTYLKELKDVIKLVPNELKEPLARLENLALSSKNQNIKLAPLYYSKMRYYDKLFFRFLCDNYVLCSGGDYEIDSLESSGFAIMTDAFLENILER